MPSWNELLNEIQNAEGPYDAILRRYLAKLHKVTGRNVIVYSSGWLQKGMMPGVEINDDDKNGFMAAIHKMDRDKGLDLILHTPGGEVAAVESIVNYLRAMFRTDMRAIIPQLAMSGGTVIACACKEIIMGKHSSLGPIDPQLRGIPAHGVIEEFERAKKEVKANPSTIPVWQAIINKYHPTLIGECEKAIAWSTEMTEEWLRTGMFKGESNVGKKIQEILDQLGDHALTKSHERHLAFDRCVDMGLKVSALEDDDDLQEAVLSLHHACMLAFTYTPAFKIIENHDGVAFIKKFTPAPSLLTREMSATSQDQPPPMPDASGAPAKESAGRQG